MTKEEGAKILAVKYVLDLNTFRKSERMKDDLTWIRTMYMSDTDFERLFDRYCADLRERKDMPRWAKLVMAERYAINI